MAAPQQGRVLLGGVDIATLSAEDVRARIGWLAQATSSVPRHDPRQPEAGATYADEAALCGTLDAARVGEIVRALPDGLDTWVGGKRRALLRRAGAAAAPARALLSPAPIDFDQPCAGLDAGNRTRIPGHAERGRRGRRLGSRIDDRRGKRLGLHLAVVRRQGDRRRGVARYFRTARPA